VLKDFSGENLSSLWARHLCRETSFLLNEKCNHRAPVVLQGFEAGMQLKRFSPGHFTVMASEGTCRHSSSAGYCHVEIKAIFWLISIGKGENPYFTLMAL